MMFQKISLIQTLSFLFTLNIAACTLFAAPSPSEKEKKPIKITEENFQSTVLESEKLFVLVFSAEWCSFCNDYKKILH